MGTGGRQAEMSRPGNGCALGPDKSTGKKISHLTQEKELEGDVSVNLSAFVLNPA